MDHVWNSLKQWEDIRSNRPDRRGCNLSFFMLKAMILLTQKPPVEVLSTTEKNITKLWQFLTKFVSLFPYSTLFFSYLCVCMYGDKR
jgi:hypothetical protein